MISVPYGMAVHGEAEIEAVTRVLRESTQMGRHVDAFEQSVARLFDKTHGIMVNSGSSALLLAAKILDLPSGSEVITPALTFATTVGSLVQNDLVPAFVDVKRGTFCIDPDRIEDMISDNTRAMCIPNLIGNVCEWDRIAEIARKYDLKIIEDSADTLGATLNGQASGAWSDISITSFYGSHVINCAGNGGMLCVNSNAMADRARLLRSWGRSSSLFKDSERIENRFDVTVDGVEYDAKFVFEELGYNLEPSEVGAAFGLVQLEKLESNIKARIDNFRQQYEFFARYEDWFELPVQTSGVRTGWLAFPLVVRDAAPFSRREFQVALERNRVQTRVVFTGNILRQPALKGVKVRTAKTGYPEADRVMQGGVLLACHHGMTDQMMAHLHHSVDAFASQF